MLRISFSTPYGMPTEFGNYLIFQYSYVLKSDPVAMRATSPLHFPYNECRLRSPALQLVSMRIPRPWATRCPYRQPAQSPLPARRDLRRSRRPSLRHGRQETVRQTPLLGARHVAQPAIALGQVRSHRPRDRPFAAPHRVADFIVTHQRIRRVGVHPSAPVHCAEGGHMLRSAVARLEARRHEPETDTRPPSLTWLRIPRQQRSPGFPAPPRRLSRAARSTTRLAR